MTRTASRRRLLGTAAALAAGGVGAPIALNLLAAAAASAQSAPDYKALVCLYLAGGNDHLNTVVPYDATSYGTYQRMRGGLALDRSTLLPLALRTAQGGREVALNPALAGVKSLYDLGRVAVLSNVGPLVAPSSKADLAANRVPYPRQIGSHNDQSNTWLSLATSNPFGWGGRFGDALAASNGQAAFTTMTATGGYSLFLVGARTSFFTVSEGGAPSAFFSAGSPMEAAVAGSASRANLLEKAYAQTHETLRDGAAALSGALPPENTFAVPPGGGQNLVAQQLLTVARVMAARTALGLKRQVFYVELGGFDTHGGQASRHAGLMTQLDAALAYFDALLGQLNLRNQVTTFTASEFGRTFTSNGDGTDHGWGSHHLVMGGAVRGGDVFGALPVVDPAGPDFNDSLMIPTTSIEQLGATLGRWMGVSATEVADVFPSLGRFAAADLGLFA